MFTPFAMPRVRNICDDQTFSDLHFWWLACRPLAFFSLVVRWLVAICFLMTILQ